MGILDSWHPEILPWFEHIKETPRTFAHAKKLYRKAALMLHPDKPTGDAEKFKQLQAALEGLQGLFATGLAETTFKLYHEEIRRKQSPASYPSWRQVRLRFVDEDVEKRLRYLLMINLECLYLIPQLLARAKREMCHMLKYISFFLRLASDPAVVGYHVYPVPPKDFIKDLYKLVPLILSTFSHEKFNPLDDGEISFLNDHFFSSFLSTSDQMHTKNQWKMSSDSKIEYRFNELRPGERLRQAMANHEGVDMIPKATVDAMRSELEAEYLELEKEVQKWKDKAKLAPHCSPDMDLLRKQVTAATATSAKDKQRADRAEKAVTMTKKTVKGLKDKLATSRLLIKTLRNEAEQQRCRAREIDTLLARTQLEVDTAAIPDVPRAWSCSLSSPSDIVEALFGKYDIGMTRLLDDVGELFKFLSAIERHQGRFLLRDAYRLAYLYTQAQMGKSRATKRPTTRPGTG